MADVEENKFLVLNRKFLCRLNEREQTKLLELMRKADPDSHRYWVCNQDEPYASEVMRSIISGEAAKEQLGDIKKKVGDSLFNVCFYCVGTCGVEEVSAESFEEALLLARNSFDAQEFEIGCRELADANIDVGVSIDKITSDGDIEKGIYLPAWTYVKREQTDSEREQ